MIPRRYQRIRQMLARRQPDLTVLTEDVHKPHNFSAIIRTCDAVGVFKVHAVNVTAAMPTFSPVAQGSEKWVLRQTHPDIESAIATLQAQNFRVYAAHLSEQAQDYSTVDYTQPTAILMGAEKWGVSTTAAAKADGHVIIPMLGMVESLNVSVAAATILFEAQRQRLAAGMYERDCIDQNLRDRLLFEWGYPKLANIYRQRGEPYPNLGENGEILGSASRSIEQSN
ncbi:MAG: tRNA (guanosine(18)-2'-O)-methyltransferase TrmH [Cyanobacteria bacterium P01_H01_bin.15]